MGVRLQRHLGSRDMLEAGQFLSEPLRPAQGRNIAVAIGCPCCGSISDLAAHHVVDPSGLMTPAWSCPSEACPFMDWLELDSWGQPI
jgi:hypothetical protein